MKNIIGLVLLFSLSPVIFAAEGQLPKKTTILGEELVLKYQQSESGKTLAEYIPTGQTLDNWKLMYAIRTYNGSNLDAKASVMATAQNIKKRKESGDKSANYAIFKGDDGSYSIDFLISDQKTVFEHNIFKYIKTDDGLVSLQVARRLYLKNKTEKQIKQFFQEIPDIRNRVLKELASQVLPRK